MFQLNVGISAGIQVVQVVSGSGEERLEVYPINIYSLHVHVERKKRKTVRRFFCSRML